jgi:hypothetical protein
MEAHCRGIDRICFDRTPQIRDSAQFRNEQTRSKISRKIFFHQSYAGRWDSDSIHVLTEIPANTPMQNRGEIIGGRMTEQTTSNESLATAVANPTIENVFELRKRLEVLTGQAIGMAKSIVSQTQDVDAIWADLLPVLSEVQSLLSKRCDRRHQRRAIGFPRWEHWRRSFLKDSGLNVCERTAQRRLSAFRELMAPGDKKPGGRSEGTTSMERYQGLLAQQAANKLFETLIDGDDYGDALASFLSTRIGPDRLQEMITRCPKPREASSIGGQASSSTHYTPDMFSFRFHGPQQASECEIDFRPGGWALLAEYIAIEHSRQFKLVFATLPLAYKHQAFMNLMRAISKIVVHLDFVDDDEQLRLPAACATEDSEPLQTA